MELATGATSSTLGAEMQNGKSRNSPVSSVVEKAREKKLIVNEGCRNRARWPALCSTLMPPERILQRQKELKHSRHRCHPGCRPNESTVSCYAKTNQKEPRSSAVRLRVELRSAPASRARRNSALRPLPGHRPPRPTQLCGLGSTQFSGKQKGKQRVPSTLVFAFPEISRENRGQNLRQN